MFLPTSRDLALREILDGAMPPELARRGVPLEDAQRRIVLGIERLLRRTLSDVPILSLATRLCRRRWREHPHRRVRIHEAAAGAAWFTERLGRRLERCRIPFELTISDLDPAFVESARRRLEHRGWPLRAEVADVRRLDAFEDRSCDYVFLIYTLHHLAAAEVVPVLRELDRVAARGLVAVDLDRNRFALAAQRWLVPWIVPEARPFLAHDGAISVRRAYGRRELETSLIAAGIAARYRVERLPGCHPQRWISNVIRPREDVEASSIPDRAARPRC